MAPITALTGGLLGLLGLGLIQWVHPPGKTGHELSPNAVQAVTVFFEYVPLSVVLLLALEVNGAGSELVAVLSGLLLVSRCIHVEALRRSADHTPLRRAGSMLNWLFLLVASFALLWCAAQGVG